MRRRLHTLLSLTICPLLAVCASNAAAGTVAPLPRSDYAVRPACSRPQPHHAGCLALRLLPQTTAARAHTHPLGMSRALATTSVHPLSAAEGGDGLRPQDLRAAYFPGEQPEAPASEPQTIAIVDAYNDPTVESDLATYDSEFALPACTTANGCFAVVNQEGKSGPLPFPASKLELESARKSANKARRTEAEEAGGWAVEISTDVQMARAICHANCRIVLVEADTPTYSDLAAAEEAAVKYGATEISNSWGGGESPEFDSAFEHPGVAITASSGDEGYRNWTEAAESGEGNYYAGADYPASYPHVVAVGGTKLTLAGGARQSETVWNEDPDVHGENHGSSGGGCSESFAAPSWQSGVPDWSAVGCGGSRAVADVAADADPYTGVAVYDSMPDEEGVVLHWVPIGGTSVASPIVASMFALAGGAHEVAYPAQTLYSHLGASLLYDVTAGGNGECHDEYSSCTASSDPLLDCGSGVLICNAFSGYDGPTGVGTPNGVGAFEISHPPVEEGKEEESEPIGEPGKEEGVPEEPAKEETKQEEPGSKGSEEEPPGGEGAGGLGGKQKDSGSSEQPAGESLSSPAPALTGFASRESPVSALASGRAARISALKLTARARSALRHDRHFTAVAFSFDLSAAATVRATLSVRVGSRAHRHWRAVRTSSAFAAIGGINRRQLHLSHALTPGAYRLTLLPHMGVPRSLPIHVP